VTPISALAFGDLDAGTWGLSWSGDASASVPLAVSRGATATTLQVVLRRGGPDEAWGVEGDGVSLVLEPTGLPGHGGTPGELETTDQICRVTGQLAVDGSPAELECLGWRSFVNRESDLSAVMSFRWLAAWLGPGDGFSLVALRPRKARGHDADLVAASVIDDPPPPRIDDPRLSTTYTDAGLPLRAGLELWPEADDADDPDAEPSHHYPRRATGQAVGERLTWEASGFALTGSPLRWQSRGHDGPGVYLLGQRR
jgi:hypothetical protein